MYKKSNTSKLKKGIITGTLLLGVAGCSDVTVSESTISVESESLEEESKSNNEQEKEQLITIGQELNGCIVYKVITKTRTINPETGGTTPWISEVSEDFYIGTLTEIYNEPIDINETMQIEKRIMGYINNEYKLKDFYVKSMTYDAEYCDEGEWEKTGEMVTIDNNEIDLPPRCMMRWVKDKSKTTEIQRIPEASEIKLMRRYEVTIHDGDYQYLMTPEFTTLINLPNTGMEYKEAGEYKLSPELKNKNNIYPENDLETNKVYTINI